MAQVKVRESSFELIRLLAMWMIVIYHQFDQHLYVEYPSPFNGGIRIPLHIGVPLFILITGYWGIHMSGKSLVRIISKMVIYTIPSALIFNVLTYGGG